MAHRFHLGTRTFTVKPEDAGLRQRHIEEIKGGIRELDKLTRDRFVKTFEAVGAAFSEIFVKLFGGGEGAISLNMPVRTS